MFGWKESPHSDIQSPIKLLTKKTRFNTKDEEEQKPHPLDLEYPQGAALAKGIESFTADASLKGRGGFVNKHTANVHFVATLRKYEPTYSGATKAEKKQGITKDAIREIRQKYPRTRFLEMEEGVAVWNELDMDGAVRKTAQAMRDLKNKKKKTMVAEEG